MTTTTHPNAPLGANSATGAPGATSATSANREKVVIPVSGMTCAACQGRVQRTLGKTPGVLDANVNLMTNSATVSFDPQQVDPAALVARIRDTGYGADLPVAGRTAADEQLAQDSARRREYTDLRAKALVAGGGGVVAMVLSMPLMAANAHLGMGGNPDPFMRWTMTVLDPAMQRAMPWAYAIPASVLSVLLLVLTVGIMGWSGRHFYSRAWQSFRHRSADMNTLIAIGTGAAFLFSAAATLVPGFFLSRGVAPDRTDPRSTRG